MEYTKYQQGDVLLKKVTEKDFYASLNSNFIRTPMSQLGERAILKEGEGTGHCHAIYLEDMLEESGITLCKNYEHSDNQGLIVTGNDVPLKHEEHNTVILKSGFYIQETVQAFNHETQRTQEVAD